MDIYSMQKFVKNFSDESDRACAILARALIDDTLKELFEKLFIQKITKTQKNELLGWFGPISTLRGKALVAYSIALIGRQEYESIEIIRSIGNDFAHKKSHELKLDAKDIKKKVDSSSILKKVLNGKNQELDKKAQTPRGKFELLLGLTHFCLSERVKIAQARETYEIEILS